MLNPEERYRLLEEASELNERWESQVVDERLSTLQPEYLLLEPELGHLLSVALYRTGRQREAEEWVRKLTGPCRNHSKVLYGRHLLLAGSLYVEQGDLEEGKFLFERVTALAADIQDQRLLASAAMNIGVVCAIHCRWREGLAAFHRAAAVYTQRGETIGVAHCAHNTGMMHREMGNLSAAADMFDSAVQHYSTSSNFHQLASTESERALLFHASNDSDLAEAAASRSLNLALSLNNLRQEGEVLRVFGIIRRTQGRYPEAQAHLERALVLARQTNTALLEAEVNEELAILAWMRRDLDTAGSRARKATVIFERLGAQPRAERVHERLHVA